jgi:dienelactone hydrolase
MFFLRSFLTKAILASFLLDMVSFSAISATTEMITYRDGETELEGYLAVPEGTTGTVPGILIVHQWMGVTDHEKEVADRLAAEGYAAFACDIYGKDDRPKDRSEAGKHAGMYKGDVDLYRQRLKAGLNTLRSRSEVDADRIAVIGYCFGGTGALELARSGADIKAAVSLHGGLSTPNPEDAKQIKGTVLVAHGADDAAVSDSELMAFIEEMRNADVDWYLMMFGNSVHGFTHRHDADRYNEKAEERSWEAMTDLFEEVFSE